MEEKTITLNENVEPRGGSSILSVNEDLFIFGGADRMLNNFSDLIVFKNSDNEWKRVDTKGDIPCARSGHAVTSFGKYMFLFGGIDYKEEIVFNDTYTLNTETYEWKYVGEAGVEIPARNSHCMEMIYLNSTNPEEKQNPHLVIYGGASPELGTLGDTYYAALPIDPCLIDTEDFFLTWHRLSYTEEDNDMKHPNQREMHSSCNANIDGYGNGMVICGGRDIDEGLYADCWILRLLLLHSDVPPKDNNEKECLTKLQWTKLSHLELSTVLCSHSLVAIPSSEGPLSTLCIYGGITHEGLSNHLYTADTRRVEGGWIQSETSFPARFGQACCLAPKRFAMRGMLVFGGVNAEQDFGDLRLLRNEE